MAENKVKYGLKNVHYALVTESTVGGVTTSAYGTVKPILGAVSLSMSSNADRSVFRADNSDFFVSYGQGGYEGDLEIARVNEDFMKDVLSYKEDDDGILVEASEDFKTTKYFALMFEFDGDQRETKHCLYKVSCSRPNIASQTTGEGGTIDPQTETLSLTAVPRADADGYLHVQTQETTDSAVVSAWYTAVPVPTFT